MAKDFGQYCCNIMWDIIIWIIGLYFDDPYAIAVIADRIELLQPWIIISIYMIGIFVMFIVWIFHLLTNLMDYHI